MRRLDLRVVKLGFATRGAVHTCFGISMSVISSVQGKDTNSETGVHGAAGGEAEFYYS
jgi:hypothetical protein